jgi:probable HAF family extracellular repeat protein
MVAGTGRSTPDARHRSAVVEYEGRTAVAGSATQGHGNAATGIAADGRVSGIRNFDGTGSLPSGFVWSRVGRTVIADSADARGISRDGVVVGRRSSRPSAYTWRDGVMTDLGAPAGRDWSEGTAISPDAHWVAGDGSARDAGGTFYTDLYLWHDGAWRVAGRFGAARAEAHAINSAGVTAGEVVYELSDGGGTHYVHRGLVVRDGIGLQFGALEVGHDASANGVNEEGVVVGTMTVDEGAGPRAAAVVVRPGEEPRKLEDLLDPADADWTLREATAINDRGQIVGIGRHRGHRAAFLMTPRH